MNNETLKALSEMIEFELKMWHDQEKQFEDNTTSNFIAGNINALNHIKDWIKDYEN